MKAKSVSETLALYNEGTVTNGEMLDMLLCLVTRDNVDDLIAGLPDNLRDNFVAWAHQHYGGKLSDEEAIHIGGEGYEPPSEETTLAIRAWLARNPL